MKSNLTKNKKGFTLTEVMTVVLIIGTLAAIAYPMYSRAVIKARLAEAISLVEIVRSAQQRYMTVNNVGYFTAFTAPQISGETRIIKARGLSIDGGSLKREHYWVTIKNPKGSSDYTPHSCMEVVYGETKNNPIFTIQALVEDSKMYCSEQDAQNGICNSISDRSTSTLCDSGASS